MHELDDNTLLRQYAEQNSEAAFAALVARHVDKVYSVALRRTRNAHAAEEITQAVFVILAKKSGRLGAKVILSGWLYETSRLTAVTYIRSEIRRARREQEAHMQTALNENDSEAWPHIAPLLDDALAGLSAADRHAVVLRYFDGKSLGEVGVALGASEDAAKKRVTRAVEKLRGYFAKRGVTLTATVLTAAISANSVQAAPLGLAATVTAAAAKGTLISATITTLVNTTMKTMTWIKIKFAVGVSVAALLAGGAATVAISQTTGGGKKTSGEATLQKSRDAYAALTSYSDSGKSVVAFKGTTISLVHTFTTKLARPNLYRIEWEQRSGKYSNGKQCVWSEGKGDFLKALGKVEPEASMENGLIDATSRPGNSTITIPGAFFKLNSGNSLGASAANETQQADEKVGDADCHVFTSALNGRTRTIWIGKKDFLIHQARIVTSEIDRLTKATFVQAQLSAGAPKIEPTAITITETHENIVVNQKFSPSDFAN